MSEHEQQSDTRSGAVGATAHNPSVNTVSNLTPSEVMIGGTPVPTTELCWLDYNAGNSQWEIWTSRGSRKLMLYSSGRDHVRAPWP